QGVRDERCAVSITLCDEVSYRLLGAMWVMHSPPRAGVPWAAWGGRACNSMVWARRECALPGGTPALARSGTFR
ncbi:MAG: hypothetical protein ACUVWS_18955, partial [Roseiflexus sp.]